MKIKVRLSIWLCVSMLTGCSFSFGNPLNTSGLTGNGDGNPQELTPDFSYAYEEQTYAILVNQIGYRPGDAKVAILQGSNLEESFTVYEKDTNRAVFFGTLKEAGPMEYGRADNESGSSLYLADFSELEEAGSYYVFHKTLGYSTPFSIGESVYDSLEKYLLEQLAVENRNTVSLCYQLAGMMLTLELYSEQIQNLEEVHRILQEKIELLQKAQDEESGSVYETIPQEAGNLDMAAEEASDEEYILSGYIVPVISLEASAEYAGVMAMYSCYIEGIDRTAANQYSRLAQKAFSSITRSLDGVSFDAGYFAASYLYKNTLYAKYGQITGQYLAMEEEQKSYTEYDFTLFGDYAYLTGRQGINLEWSKQLMNKVMKQAEEISLAGSRENYYVSEKREFHDSDGMLQDMSVMALVNYVITNHEYSTLLKNYLDYFLGRNPQARCLVEGFGDREPLAGQEGILNRSYMALMYLLLQSTKG